MVVLFLWEIPYHVVLKGTFEIIFAQYCKYRETETEIKKEIKRETETAALNKTIPNCQKETTKT